jgi:acetolactate synthase-1/2/3 large subunit
VNQNESREALGVNVRQAGFQETDIATIVASITKFAKKVESVEELIETLPMILSIATSGRMGPVLLDIPMNIQKAEISSEQRERALRIRTEENDSSDPVDLVSIMNRALRPVVMIGAGAALAGAARDIQKWCEEFEIPYVTSWGAITYVDRSAKHYFGSHGVYGSRKANWLVQAADELVVLGSRLDNRQRTGNPFGFAPFATVSVVDIDDEELKKYKAHPNYETFRNDLRTIGKSLSPTKSHKEWYLSANEVTNEMPTGFNYSVAEGEFNPYAAVQIAQTKFEPGSIVVSDCGANLCWVYQSYAPDDSFLFTAGGNSPMGYSLPAAIGAQLLNPKKKVYCFIGDGGLQMNIQELQTIIAYNLPITIIIQNNFGYGIIKQFQDANFEGRHFASGDGYTLPSFEKIAAAYNIPYFSVKTSLELDQLLVPKSACVIDIHLPANSLITPKTEGDNFIHNQFPYVSDNSIQNLPYKYPVRPSQL